MGAGIIGMGVSFPDGIRTNRWWPQTTVAQWRERMSRDITKSNLKLPEARSEAQGIQLEYMAATYGDPFRGSVERRIAGPELKTSDLQTAAAREALERAGVDPVDITLLLESSLPSDRIHPGNGVLIARELGLKRATALTVDSGCSSFLGQAALADAMISSGQAKYVLIVNGAIFSRLIDWNDPTSVNFGDGAAAAVVGPTPRDLGFSAHASRTQPDYYDGVVVMPRDTTKCWYQDHASFVGSANVEMGREMVMSVAEEAKEGLETALRRAGVEKQNVTNYYAHQAVSFFGPATRHAAGLTHARTADTFRKYGNVSAASIMVNLYEGQQQGQLQQGALTALFAIGPGMNWMSSVLRWAR